MRNFVFLLLSFALLVDGYRFKRIMRISEDNRLTNNICTTSTPTKSPFGQCAAEVCGNYTHSCSSNPKCLCLQTTEYGKGICSSADYCDRRCDDCPPEYGFCVVNSCCGHPVCNRHSDAESCKDPPTVDSIQLAKRKECRKDLECGNGKSCRQQSSGMFCVD
ncbi:hypothetical protein M3Y96_00521600 [Aphelenchoides besseyi]|nr:hypothetical protein M3Y96_00521600 [Aphelenchoides besseyi]